MEKKKNATIIIAIIILVILVDQTIKIWVKTNMSLYQMFEITDWFKIYFVENNGMAFGWEVMGKLFLSIFRIMFSGYIAYYIYQLLRKGVSLGYTICVALIFAGALGNILDSIFYGVIFSESTYWNIAQVVPLGQGYADWLYGKVVDMFYFPIIQTTYPTWLPMVGGQEFIFFSPIFNFADASVSCGIVSILLFYRKTLYATFQ